MVRAERRGRKSSVNFPEKEEGERQKHELGERKMPGEVIQKIVAIEPDKMYILNVRKAVSRP